MRQMKPLLKYNPPNPYTWSYEFDTLLVGGQIYVNQYYTVYSHSDWWISSVSYPFNKAGVPFWIPKDASLTINWGDGTIETITGTYTKEEVVNNFVSLGNSVPFNNGLIHTYTTAGTYTISVTSSDWNKIWLCGGDPGNGGYYILGYSSHWYLHSLDLAYAIYVNPDFYVDIDTGNGYDDGFNLSITGQVAAMRMGCIKILNPLPSIAGVLIADYTKVTNEDKINHAPEGFFDNVPYEYGTFLPKSMFYALGFYFRLTDLPKNLFIYNQFANDFTGCLWNVPTPVRSNVLYNNKKSISYPDIHLLT